MPTAKLTVAPLSINPNVIRFENIAPGILYVITFSVRNNNPQATRIRVVPPKKTFFSCNYVPTSAVATGLDIRVEVECLVPMSHNPDENVFEDFLVVTTGDYKVQVPIIASKPLADVHFDHLLDLGLIVENTSVTKPIRFLNHGTAPATISIEKADRFLVQPLQFQLEGAAEGTDKHFRDVMVTFHAADAGLARELLQVTVSGILDSKLLDLCAQVITPQLSLHEPNNASLLSSIDFGSILYGTSTTFEGILTNLCAIPVSYAVRYLDSEEASISEEDLIDVSATEKPYTIVPAEGTLKAFEETRVKFSFCPKTPFLAKGFANKFFNENAEPKLLSLQVAIESADATTTKAASVSLPIKLLGRACMPVFTLSPDVLRFGDCAVHDRRDVLLSLVSQSDLDFAFEFSAVTFFKLTPASGLLRARQTVPIVASFTPAQLGKFNKRMLLSVGGGVRTLEVKLIAEASSLNAVKTVVGGTDKLPEDFKPKYQFVEPGAVQKKKQETFQREQPWNKEEFLTSLSWNEESMGKNDKSFSYDSNGPVTFSRQTLQRRAMHRQKYNDFLEESREQRALRSKGKVVEDERGLTEPVLRLPPAPDQLWMLSSDKNSKRDAALLDENRLIAAKYPMTPQTQSEMKDCVVELSADDYKLVVASHKVIHYGKISITSVNAKNFTIHNNLPRPIIVRIADIDKDLRDSTPLAQVIPGRTIAGFDIIWNAASLGKFKRSFSWSVNGFRSTTVTAVAEIIPIELTLSSPSVTMAFASDSLEKSCSQEIQLSNNTNTKAAFEWVSDASFVCKPDKGLIERGQSMPITVHWTPVYGTPNNASLKLRVQGGSEQLLPVIGDFGSEPKAVFETKQADFGIVAVGMENKITARLKNVGNCPLVFRIDRLNDSLGLQTSPDRGRIQPGDVCAIEIVVRPGRVNSYENISIVAQVRGGKPVTLKCIGQAVIPDITVLDESYDFGTVIYGSMQKAPFRITNNSPICDACLWLDLADYSDFKPTFARVDGVEVVEHEGGWVDSLGNSIEDLALKSTSHHADDKDASSIGRAETNSGDNKRPRTAGALRNVVMSMKANKALTGGILGRNDKRGTWQIVVAAGQTFTGELHFNPTRPKVHHFKLPLILKGHAASASLKNPVDAVCLPSKLQFSELLVDFGDRVLSRDPSSRRSHYKEVEVSNADLHSSISYRIVPEPGQPEVDSTVPIFVLVPAEAELGVGKSSPLRITFSPSHSGFFEMRFSIYIESQPDPTRPYLTLHCKGSGVYPKLNFSTQLVTFPTVPLGVTSRAEFNVISAGYDALDLQYRFSPSVSASINLEFPDGNEVGLTTASVKVIASFSSETALSFYGQIIFLDRSGEKFGVDVRGCADNCIFSNYSFLRDYRDQYCFHGLEGMPVALMTRKELAAQKEAEGKREKDLARANSLVKKGSISEKEKVPEESTGIDLSRPFCSNFTDAECEVLIKWLNRVASKRSLDSTRFPACCYESNGDVAIECMEQMCGKKLIPPKNPKDDIGSKAPIARTMQVNRLISKYRAVLTSLIRNGALLSHINPLHLLSKDDFFIGSETLFKEDTERFTPAILKERKVEWEASWLSLCKQSWADVLYQAVKVYLLSRVTFKAFTKMPGIQYAVEGSDKDKAGKAKVLNVPQVFAGSNVINENESVLLEWINYHTAAARSLVDEGASSSNRIMGVKRIIDVESDLKDTFAFCQVLHSHVPEFAANGGPLFGYSAQTPSKQNDFFSYLSSALVASRMNFDASYAELISSDRILVLLALHLFLGVPSLIPKTEIEFKGALAEPITKLISLKNPSKRSISYSVILEGNPDFKIKDTQLVLSPESTVDFPVELVAKFSEKRTAKVTFASLRENGVAGSMMVFKLYSNIVSRIPITVVKRSVSLFEYRTISIEVVNPFEKSATFLVKLHIQYTPSSLEEVLKDAPKSKSSGNLITRKLSQIDFGDDAVEIENLFRRPCWTQDEKVLIEAGATRTITVHCLPFMIGQYSCQVVLSDAKIGEFCYEALVEVGLPISSDTIEFTVGKSVTKGNKILHIASKNSLFDRALITAIDYRIPAAAKKVKARQLMGGLIAAPILDPDTGRSNFFAEFSNAVFSCPRELSFVSEYIRDYSASALARAAKFKKTLKTYNEETSDVDSSAFRSNGLNSVALSFTPENAGAYRSRLVVFAKDNPFDIRCIDVVATVVIIDPHATIEFKAPARQTVVQVIPITNRSEHDWELTVTVQANNKAFSGQRFCKVPRGATFNYELSFVGAYMGEFLGKLVFTSNTTDETFEYKLLGVAEEPLAEDNLRLRCVARTKTPSAVPVRRLPTSGNNSSLQTFVVTTDMPYLLGPPSVEVSGNADVKYEFFINSPVSGLLNGSLTFTDAASNAMLWYTFDISVDAPYAESEISVEAVVRTAVVVEIMLENPSHETKVFEVEVDGEGLIGDNYFSLPPKSGKVPYELIYSPLKVGAFTGSISFTSQRAGQFWYKVNLLASEGPAIVVDTMECMMGMSATTRVNVENPLGEPVTFDIKLSDPIAFSVEQDSVTLGPYAQSQFNLTFTPAKLYDSEVSYIYLSHPKFGQIKYQVSGVGLLPGNMAATEISSPVDVLGSHTISFLNPFRHPLPVDVILMNSSEKDPNDDSEPFQLLLRKTAGVVISSQATLQIGMSFTPRTLRSYSAVVQVRSAVEGRNLLWCYPLEGIADAGQPIHLRGISIPCKTSVTREIEIKLPGLRSTDVGIMQGLSIDSFILDVAPELQHKAIIARALRIQPTEFVRIYDDVTAEFALKYKVLFEPLKVFSSQVNLTVTCKNVGRWKADLDVESLQPEPDDVIRLRAAVGSSDRVSFRLNNRFLSYSPFKCYFAPRSSTKFTVTPNAGVLAPYGAEGTTFYVTFSPTEYGPFQRGHLIIDTDDVQWDYEVIGEFPEYDINKLEIKSKTQSHR